MERSSPLGVTSIGKGYYEFVFSLIEDARRVRSVNSWPLNPGFLKLFPWSRDFSPSQQSNSSAQVWLRIHGLAQEYWRKKTIFAIASSAGTPICVDSVTSKPALERTFGHYARVLVNIDVSDDLKHEVLVERKGFAFFVQLEYENLPEFCRFCKTVGHGVDVCRKAMKTNNGWKNKPKESGIDAGKVHAKAKDHSNVWIPKDTNVIDLEKEEPIRDATTLLNETEADEEQANIRKSPINLEPIIASPAPSDNRVNDDEVIANNSLDQPLELDDGESQESEFVDATQRREPEMHTDALVTPVRIQNDIHFLNESWANLEGIDEEQIRMQQQALNESIAAELEIDQQIAHEIQQNIDTAGFQTVTSRSAKKKLAKALKSQASSSYLTRSKVSTRPSQ